MSKTTVNLNDGQRLKDRWCPWMTYSVTLAELEQWALMYGPSAFYNGKMWQIKHKRIAGTVHHVWFEEMK